MSYLSAPLWLAFVVLGVVLWLTGGHALLDLRQGVPAPVLALWAATLGMLLLPRALGAALVLRERQQHLYGGTLRLVASSLLEVLLSALQSPLRMAAHTLFVLGALTGLKLEWRSPPRGAARLAWGDAARPLLPLSLLAALALGAALQAEISVALWLAPVALPLVLALPLVVWASRPALGRRVRRAGLLLTPEETAPHRVLRHAWAEAERPLPATLAAAPPPVGEVIALRALPRWASPGAAAQVANRRR